MVGDGVLTVGDLAGRTGMSPRLIRRLTDLGLIYSSGRSTANYRQYDQSAIWCIEIITELRSLGLTIAEIEKLADAYLHGLDGDGDEMLNDLLDGARQRVTEQIRELEELKARQNRAQAESTLKELAAADPTRT